ncbi:MAG: ABC transporter permease [Actinobacteria bacterium]|nr:ABC transporter permease [Actinomycetota bacterium]
MAEVRQPAVAAPELSSLLDKRRRRLAAAAFVRGAALVPVIAVLLIVGSIISPVFLTTSNLAQVGQEISALGVVVVGEALIIIIGGMDLSLESTFGLSAMVAAWLIIPTANYGEGTVWSPFLGIVALLAVGVAIGFVNGLAIVKGRLNGFIWTLGMTVVLGGIQDGMVNGQSLYNLPNTFNWLGSAYVGSIPVSLLVTGAIFVGVGLFLRYHSVGRQIYAIGGNIAAARAAGMRVDRIRIGVYVAGSVLAAIGGLMEAGRVQAVAADQGYGEGIIFNVFAAAVIGGVSLKGGRGGMLGAASGVVLLGLVQNILDLGGVNNYWILAITGGVILVALMMARVIGGEVTAE